MGIKRLFISLGFVVAILLFAGGYTLGQSEYAPVDLSGMEGHGIRGANDAFDPFWETLDLIRDEYFEQPLADEQLAKGAIDGMLATLGDPNTRYLPPDQEQAARNAMEGNLEGIGAEVSAIDGAIIVVSPYEGSPAEEAGIRAGDILRAADGTELTGLHPAEAASLVRGPSGTIVVLLVERDGELLEIEVTRGVIKIPSVRGELLDDSVVYLRLSRFGNKTSEELMEIIDKLVTDDTTGIVLDLRSNPGGGLNTAVDVADHFLDEGNVLVERFGNGKEIEFDSEDGEDAEQIPLVVLINEGSASASEVVAGAVQDRERGILIGDTSFGKGTVQVWKQLSNDGGLRITVARWLTPDGAWVHEQGLQPDYLISLPDLDGGEFTDTQLEAAVDYILGRPVIESSPADEG